jgi:hypothetical protein
MSYPTDFFIRIFYEKPFNQGLFQKKMRIKLYFTVFLLDLKIFYQQ